MLGREIFKLYSKFNTLAETLQYALKSQPSPEFQKKFGTQADLFSKLIQDELKAITSDPDWNQAKLLSEKIKRDQKFKNSGTLTPKSLNTGAKRSFSTFSKLRQDNKDNKDKVQVCK